MHKSSFDDLRIPWKRSNISLDKDYKPVWMAGASEGVALESPTAQMELLLLFAILIFKMHSTAVRAARYDIRWS